MIKLGDFGLAVQLEHTNSKRDTKCGTSWYMAPEPPSLSSEKWSAAFVDFVNKCLVRDVNERWSVEQLMNVSVVWRE